MSPSFSSDMLYYMLIASSSGEPTISSWRYSERNSRSERPAFVLVLPPEYSDPDMAEQQVMFTSERFARDVLVDLAGLAKVLATHGYPPPPYDREHAEAVWEDSCREPAAHVQSVSLEHPDQLPGLDHDVDLALNFRYTPTRDELDKWTTRRIVAIQFLWDGIHEDAFDALAGMTGLRSLSANEPQLGQGSPSVFRRLRSLKTLAIRNTRIPVGCDGAIRELEKLRYLDLSGSDVTGERLLAMTPPAIRTLNVADTPVDDRISTDALWWRTLEALDLSGTQIGDSVLGHIQKHCKALRRLDVRQTEITDEGLQLAVNMDSLRELYVRGTRTTVAGIIRACEARTRCQTIA